MTDPSPATLACFVARLRGYEPDVVDRVEWCLGGRVHIPTEADVDKDGVLRFPPFTTAAPPHEWGTLRSTVLEVHFPLSGPGAPDMIKPWMMWIVVASRNRVVRVYVGARCRCIPKAFGLSVQTVVAMNLPPSVRLIDDHGFGGLRAWRTHLDLPRLEELGVAALCNTGILSATLPAVVSIGNSAFYGSQLRAINMTGAPVVSISAYCFYACEQLEEVVLSDATAFIGEGAFQKCKAITRFIGRGVTTVHHTAFANSQHDLERLTDCLPGGVHVEGGEWNHLERGTLVVADSDPAVGGGVAALGGLVVNE